MYGNIPENEDQNIGSDSERLEWIFTIYSGGNKEHKQQKYNIHLNAIFVDKSWVKGMGECLKKYFGKYL